MQICYEALDLHPTKRLVTYSSATFELVAMTLTLYLKTTVLKVYIHNTRLPLTLFLYSDLISTRS